MARKINLNKAYELTGKKFTNAYLLKMCINMVPDSGITESEVKKRLEAIELIDECKNDELILEEHQFELIKSCVIQFKWGVIEKQINDFSDSVKTMEEVKLNK